MTFPHRVIFFKKKSLQIGKTITGYAPEYFKTSIILFFFVKKASSVSHIKTLYLRWAEDLTDFLSVILV